MQIHILLAVLVYISILTAISILSRIKSPTSNDFILGSRKMNMWVTAFAVHVSDMSSWIFLAYPAVIFAQGLYGSWIAIGLSTLMLINWQYIAPRLRTATENYNSLTLPSFLESTFGDKSGFIRHYSVCISIVCYTVYISSGIVGLGILIKTIFDIPFHYGAIFGTCVMVPYLFVSGYVTLAWTDMFQGCFLVTTIILVPILAIKGIGTTNFLQSLNNIEGFLPDTSIKTILSAIFATFGWGLGYFGLPHIITKFMGIKNVKDIPKSKYIGICWQIVTLLFATLVGIVGRSYFANKNLEDTQLIFIYMVENIFPEFLGTIILCAIIGATITSVNSMILVISSNIGEDIFKKTFKPNASTWEILFVTRLSILGVALCGLLIALNTSSNIFGLVSYAWFGMGGTFGPLVICSLFVPWVNLYGAFGGLIVGGIVSLFWPFVSINWVIPASIPGFIANFITQFLLSFLTKNLRIKK